jgi:Flp pilus assembly protein TadG
MHKRLSRTVRSERGQALIEFALIFPFMMVLLFVILDFGIALDRRVVIQHAVRDGARQGAVGLAGDASGDDNDIKDYVVNQSQDVLDRANVEVCYVDGPDTGTVAGNVGDYVRVSATFVYDFSPGSGGLLPAFGVDPASLSVAMTPYAEARLERSVAGASSC